MLIIPAIDLRAGKCVRLVEGKLENETVYAEDPAAVARFWQDSGAPMLHLVDLDGAFAGKPTNIAVIEEIVKALIIPAEVGGGIRSLDAVDQLLTMGLERVILGTLAINNPEICRQAVKEFGEHIAIGIDGKNDMVAVQGWGETSNVTTQDLALQMRLMGVSHIIYTDTSRDGTLKGPNLAATKAMARAFGQGLIASGGVSCLEDVVAVKGLESYGVEGLIIGKALYEKTLRLQDAISIAADKSGNYKGWRII